jgi:NAD(P)-dependent dehydrogenase (short-subunit alcohol dehydrogenase family)
MTDELSVPANYAAGLFDLKGRVAVVTGAGSGLGAAIATGYGQVGVEVVLADINIAGAEALAEKVKSDYGHVDILVNSAGSAFRSPAEDFPEEKFNFILDLNLKGTYFCCQAFGKAMLGQHKGSIINIASIGSFVGYPWASAYLASKGGVLQITKGLALEWRDRGVRVNGIGPTLMESPLTRAATVSITADFIKARMLRPRLGLPRELIGTAVFLASDASELVTGHVVMCDDGYLTA